MKYKFLSVEEVASILKVTKMMIYRYIKTGKLTAYKVGKDYRINKEEFDKFIDSLEIKDELKSQLKKITAENYIGLAKKLVK
ncbi:MAG: DNA binding domain-containing protein [Candidatus Berkelbacteria bacterium Athens1014_28]|uniref:DNA binding domain-containing protein n=1 Tax=Candidatus Berkelbacteria bacterium Athens1014_28 TaxID=2017145 RepID=A0A554LJR7_9BACT|nr:MAG: DNA binding domain-containing protein [Candidatus Berkelbacteria bacterium Athens1014_28]